MTTDSNQKADIEYRAKLQELRDTIDSIDNDIVSLINRRLRVSQDVGELKKMYDNKVLDKSRENEIMQRLCDLNQGPVSNTVLQYIFSVIMSASRELQKPLRIAYLGPEATYTHIAAMSHFKYSGSFVPQKNITEIFAEVERGACQYGVVPVENSIEGAVNHTLDLLFESDVKICAERYQTISHDLMSETGDIRDIKVIYSHPQPFAQCRNWLQRNLPDVVLEECSSTAHAAQKAVGRKDAAAIASSKAAQVNNLKIVESRIEDSSKNETRFLVIGKDAMPKTGKDKTSIMFVTSHVPGALFKALEPVAKAGLNMVKLESRPTKSENWSYFFIMDIEGHLEEPRIKEILTVMKHLCLFMKILGSYPIQEQELK
ncbi:MAG: prephenate dehydratase [Proteobacteria bacterium]|nr:prephenate dehydratase [Pseudomonadota bacterium]